MSTAPSGNALPLNYRLDEYVIQSVLGQGGFGITYLARDARLGALVAVKEYFPQAYAQRDRTLTIHPNTQGDTSDVENYRWGLREFLKEARALAQFKHANIVRVLRFLEANGTAYMVMEYEEGESLSDHLARHGGFLGEPALLQIFLPVLNGLQAVHDAGLLHLDIKPDNIYLRRTGQPMLIDFGAARQRQGEGRGEKVALTPGYCALEQYPGHGDLGTWSDVYSMGATLYRCITGKEPTDALERERGLKKLHIDPQIPAARFDRPLYSAYIRTSVDAAMALRADDRPRSASALQNGLMGKELIDVRKTVADNAYSRGPGYIGVVQAADTGKRRRFIPRGPFEITLVVVMFLAVLIVAPLRIMLATGQLTDDQLYDGMDRVHTTIVETGKQATRYVEENVLGIRRPPDYVSPPPALHAIARQVLAKAPEEKPVAPFETAKTLAATLELSGVAVSMAWVLDGQRLAIAYDDGSVELRSLTDTAAPRRLQGATGMATVVAASPDGKRLAFGTGDSAIQIWDVEKNVFLTELPGHLDEIVALVFSPDGHRLASASRDQDAMLWDVDGGTMLLDLGKPSNEPLALAFSPDGATLAVGDSAGGIRFWSLASLHDIAYVPTRDQPVTALAYSPDGKHFAVGGEQGFLSLWDVTGKRDDRLLDGTPDTVHALVFSPDSQWLIVAGSESSLGLWNTQSGQAARHYDGANHQNYALALTADGRQLGAAGADGKLTLWR